MTAELSRPLPSLQDRLQLEPRLAEGVRRTQQLTDATRKLFKLRPNVDAQLLVGLRAEQQSGVVAWTRKDQQSTNDGSSKREGISSSEPRPFYYDDSKTLVKVVLNRLGLTDQSVIEWFQDDILTSLKIGETPEQYAAECLKQVKFFPNAQVPVRAEIIVEQLTKSYSAYQKETNRWSPELLRQEVLLILKYQKFDNTFVSTWVANIVVNTGHEGAANSPQVLEERLNELKRVTKHSFDNQRLIKIFILRVMQDRSKTVIAPASKPTAQEEQSVVASPQPKVELVHSQELTRPAAAPIVVNSEVSTPAVAETPLAVAARVELLSPEKQESYREQIIQNEFRIAGLDESPLAEQLIAISREYREAGKPAQFFEDRIGPLFVLYNLSVNEGKTATLARKIIELHRMDAQQLTEYVLSEKQKNAARTEAQAQKQQASQQGFFQKAASKLAGLFSSSK